MDFQCAYFASQTKYKFIVMERSVNRIELKGNVGQDAKITKVGESVLARFRVATNERFKDRNGVLKEETTWHSVAAWSGRGMPDFTKIKKGIFIEVTGRLKVSKYVNSDGEEKQFYEIVANRIVLDEMQNV